MKKILTLITFILFGSFVFYATVIKNLYRQQIRIDASTSKILNRITAVNNISRWYMPFASADTDAIKQPAKEKITYKTTSLEVVKLIGSEAWYRVKEDDRLDDLVFGILADGSGSSIVTLSYESTIWNNLFGSNPIIENAKKSLLGLKDYLGDIKRLYGYPIEMTTVVDTTFLFTSMIVANRFKKETIQHSYESLIEYARKKNGGYNGTRIYYELPVGSDSIHLFMSIGILHPELTPNTTSFSLKRMPYMRKLVRADYEGRFDKINMLFSALEQYKTDHKLSSMAIPFLKFDSSLTSFDDSQIIKAKGFYPVY